MIDNFIETQLRLNPLFTEQQLEKRFTLMKELEGTPEQNKDNPAYDKARDRLVSQSAESLDHYTEDELEEFARLEHEAEIVLKEKLMELDVAARNEILDAAERMLGDECKHIKFLIKEDCSSIDFDFCPLCGVQLTEISEESFGILSRDEYEEYGDDPM